MLLIFLCSDVAFLHHMDIMCRELLSYQQQLHSFHGISAQAQKGSQVVAAAMIATTGAVWDTKAYTRATPGAARDVAACAQYTQMLCRMFQPLSGMSQPSWWMFQASCGLLQPLSGMFIHYVGCFNLCARY